MGLYDLARTLLINLTKLMSFIKLIIVKIVHLHGEKIWLAARFLVVLLTCTHEKACTFRSRALFSCIGRAQSLVQAACARWRAARHLDLRAASLLMMRVSNTTRKRAASQTFSPCSNL